MAKWLHASDRSNRESIKEKGLIPHHPTQDGNYTDADPFELIHEQPRGVYVYPLEDDPGAQYSWHWYDDQWVVEYDGPVLDDLLISAARVIPVPIPPDKVQLKSSAWGIN